jgi:hypothetical protein
MYEETGLNMSAQANSCDSQVFFRVEQPEIMQNGKVPFSIFLETMSSWMELVPPSLPKGHDGGMVTVLSEG